MKITLDELYKGKATKIKEKEYFTPEQYVAPFIERISKFTNDINIYVKPSDQVTLTREGNLNFDDILYNRVWIQGIIKRDYRHDEFAQSINMVYSLDTRKPIVKFYTGAIKDNNLFVFDHENLVISEIKPETAINFAPVERLINKLDNTDVELDKLDKIILSKLDIRNNLGKYIDNCINKKYNNNFGLVKISESTSIDVFKDLFYDEKSKVYNKHAQASGSELYNAFSNIISGDEKDFINRFEKTLLINRIIEV